MSKVLDENGLKYLIDKLKSLFYQKPSTGIPKTDLADSVQSNIPNFAMVYGNATIGYASTAKSTTLNIQGLSDVYCILFTDCLDRENLRVTQVSTSNPKPKCTATSDGVSITVTVPAISGATTGTRMTTFVAIGTKK